MWWPKPSRNDSSRSNAARRLSTRSIASEIDGPQLLRVGALASRSSLASKTKRDSRRVRSLQRRSRRILSRRLRLVRSTSSQTPRFRRCHKPLGKALAAHAAIQQREVARERPKVLRALHVRRQSPLRHAPLVNIRKQLLMVMDAELIVDVPYVRLDRVV